MKLPWFTTLLRTWFNRELVLLETWDPTLWPIEPLWFKSRCERTTNHITSPQMESKHLHTSHICFSLHEQDKRWSHAAGRTKNHFSPTHQTLISGSAWPLSKLYDSLRRCEWTRAPSAWAQREREVMEGWRITGKWKRVSGQRWNEAVTIKS